MSLKSRRFAQVDVFTAKPTKGNPLAVVLDGEGLTTEAMQAFASWTNLSETTFLLPPDDPTNDYKVRIFTPGYEMPFAGHPTLGSCAAWLDAGGIAEDPALVRQECKLGVIEIDQTGEAPAFKAPATEVSPLPGAQFASIIDMLQLKPEEVIATSYLVNGPEWHCLEIRSVERLMAIDANLANPFDGSIGLFAAQEEGHEADYEVRMFARSAGITEDPITGSFNAALACWLQSEGRLTRPHTMAQGTALGREGRVSLVPKLDGSIWIGGATQIMIRGEVRL